MQTMQSPTHLSLFSGIGGLDLAAVWAGFTTVGQCEWAAYPTKILQKHWPGVPRWCDIRTLTGDSFYANTGLQTIDVLSGGFPCQPFSTAGKRRGKDDDRYLWPEMLRVIDELQPTWVVGENVAGIVSMALDDILSDLEGKGYETRAIILPAGGVGAPHRRYRVAILGNANSDGSSATPLNGCAHATGMHDPKGSVASCQSAGASRPCVHGNVAYPNKPGLQGRAQARDTHYERESPFQYTVRCCDLGDTAIKGLSDWPAGTVRRSSPFEKSERSGGWIAQPQLGIPPDGLPGWMAEPIGEWNCDWDSIPRLARGIKDRVDKIKALGNAVVPQQFYPIFSYIAKIIRICGGGLCPMER